MDILLALLTFLCFFIHTSYRIVVNKAMCHVIRCVRKGALKSRQAFYHLCVHTYIIRISSIFNPHSRICLLILEGEEGRERETSIGRLFYAAHWGSNPQPSSTCPDQETNPHPFAAWDDLPTH